MYNVAVTAIIIKDGKVLITKRHPDKKKWPSKWTFPGGGLEDADFLGTPTDINNQWYHTLENCVRREVMEEVGLRINTIEYLCNIAVPGTIIVSYIAQYQSGEVVLQETECVDYAWVDYQESKDYDLIDGLDLEIIEALCPRENRWP